MRIPPRPTAHASKDEHEDGERDDAAVRAAGRAAAASHHDLERVVRGRGIDGALTLPRVALLAMIEG